MEPSLEVFKKEKLIFQSFSKWLYPLFELEKFLDTSNYTRTNLIVCDKIVGRAAALILIYLGIRRIKAKILSEYARGALDKYKIEYEYESLVDRIGCRTEDLLRHELDPENAYKLILKKAKFAQ